MRITEVHWISAAQREVLAKHHVLTLAELATFELRDSLSNTPPVDGLRALARRARRSLGDPDPLAMLDAAAGQRGPTQKIGYPKS